MRNGAVDQMFHGPLSGLSLSLSFNEILFAYLSLLVITFSVNVPVVITEIIIYSITCRDKKKAPSLFWKYSYEAIVSRAIQWSIFIIHSYGNLKVHSKRFQQMAHFRKWDEHLYAGAACAVPLPNWITLIYLWFNCNSSLYFPAVHTFKVNWFI